MNSRRVLQEASTAYLGVSTGKGGIWHLVYELLRSVLVAAARIFVLSTGQRDAPFTQRASYQEDPK